MSPLPTTARWLIAAGFEAALRAHPTGRSESLPFALFELHLDGHAELPAWLGQMFFESSLVRPVLDFDLYLHGIALLRGDLVDDLPYWLVDYHRDLLHPKSTVPSLRTTSSQSTKSVTIDVPQLPTETTELLGGPRRNLSPCQRLSLAHSLRYYLGIALLAATLISVAMALWPYHRQLVGIMAELADLLAQWIARMFQLDASAEAVAGGLGT
ncbi:hypothetical protein DL89DRAFT_182827 [Linderina pennispora]|uniref:Uncharacterized protein n=1 Tax=Linderina pennispora TaxID=61395 RepID=A0A1Y1W5B6_9FUNG|nr:uncharacterized protein DL89DRAFT_182827 [Linderina pennispora]ORX68721.1 hypothetical protein DL89DRAFT_182827 [Linderina pennispora]